ncbi:MAG: agmatine deiminase family protein [Pseudomonadota bacterium]
MTDKTKFARPTEKQSIRHHKAKKGDKPPKSKIYYNKTPSPVRAIAEYEDMGGVLIAYPGTVAQNQPHEQRVPSGPRSFGIPDELIVRMQQNDQEYPVHIFVMCSDASAKAEIDKNLEAEAKRINVEYNPDHLHLVPWDTDTFWTRDYGPWWIHNEKTGYYGIAKHTYTTLGGGSVGLVEGAEGVDPNEGLGIFRPNDDYGAVKFSDFLNGPIRAWNKARWSGDVKQEPIPTHDWYFTGLLEVGGNYMVTSKGKIASSYLVSTQNELPSENQKWDTEPDKEEVAKRMEYILEQFNRFMGLKEYHVLTDPTGTYIGHIDCWGKFLSDDTVLIARSQNPDVEKAFKHICDSFEADGFNVARVMCQNRYVPIADTPATTAAYTNSLILNNHVYVPLSGAPYDEFDTEALLAYEKAMPDHKVVGILGKPEFPWLGTDAMHCRTRGVPRAVVDNWLKSKTPNVIDPDHK